MISTKQAPPYELLSTIANIFRGTVASENPAKVHEAPRHHLGQLEELDR